MLPPDVRVARDAQDLLIECCVGECEVYVVSNIYAADCWFSSLMYKRFGGYIWLIFYATVHRCVHWIIAGLSGSFVLNTFPDDHQTWHLILNFGFYFHTLLPDEVKFLSTCQTKETRF